MQDTTRSRDVGTPQRSFIGCDAHRGYSVFVSVDEDEKASKPTRVEHEGGALREYLASGGGRRCGGGHWELVLAGGCH
jgi:hypothetical protein